MWRYRDAWSTSYTRPGGEYSLQRGLTSLQTPSAFQPSQTLTGGRSEVRDRGDDLSADDLQRRDPIYARDEADHRLDPHTGEPAQPTDHLAHFLAVLAY